MNLEKKIINRYHSGYYKILGSRLRKKHPVFMLRLIKIIDLYSHDIDEATKMMKSLEFPDGFWKDFHVIDEKLVNS